jgi:hypothetical protein
MAGFRPTGSLRKDCGKYSYSFDCIITNNFRFIVYAFAQIHLTNFFIEPIRGKLYESINIIVDSSPISDSDCQVVFGQLSQVNGSRCICRDDDSFANIDKSRCRKY